MIRQLYAVNTRHALNGAHAGRFRQGRYHRDLLVFACTFAITPHRLHNPSQGPAMNHIEELRQVTHCLSEESAPRTESDRYRA